MTDKEKRIAVLGIDAAWTSHNPSGVSLWVREESGWQCIEVSQSYAEFCDKASEPGRCRPNVAELLSRCKELGDGAELRVVAVDIPIANEAVTGRRAADDEVSRRFARQCCAAHSPSATRPGEIGVLLSTGFSDAGFAPVFSAGAVAPALIEVYPHISLLSIAQHASSGNRPYDENMRLPYKCSKTTKYWNGLPASDRKARLVSVWRDILDRLGSFANLSKFELPDDIETKTFHELKSYEDQIDAMICAWTAAQFLEKKLIPLGDGLSSAIWVPKNLVDTERTR